MGILDPKFKYVPSSAHRTSDYLRNKFRRIQRGLDAQKQASDAEAAAIQQEASRKVAKISGRQRG